MSRLALSKSFDTFSSDPITVSRGSGTVVMRLQVTVEKPRAFNNGDALAPTTRTSTVYAVESGSLLSGDEFDDLDGIHWTVWERAMTGWDGQARVCREQRPFECDLTFTPESAGTTIDTTTGNPYPVAGTSFTVQARIAAVNDPKIRALLGADETEVILTARWGSLEVPTIKPAGLEWGMTSTLEIQGKTGTLTVRMPWPEASSPFGEAFLATWSAI
jgi:hypothetical protein